LCAKGDVLSVCVRSQQFEKGLHWLKFAILPLALLLTIGLAPKATAQKSSKSTRKVVSSVKPEYPTMLKIRHIEGQVRLTAVVLPSGTVLAVQVHGGNPILVENAVKAVKEWKYAPGPAQTDEEVVLDFVAN
jgi:TonB family protein